MVNVSRKLRTAKDKTCNQISKRIVINAIFVSAIEYILDRRKKNAKFDV